MAPRDFCTQEPPHFESFFQISRRFKNVEKKEQIQVPCTSANAEDSKKLIFTFLTIFDKNTGHRVTKICPEYLISDTYKCYFICFFQLEIFFLVFYIRYFVLTFKRRRDGVVVRAVDGKFAIPGSSRASDNFFLFFFLLFHLPHLRKANKLRICGRRRVFFGQKSSAFCVKFTT